MNKGQLVTMCINHWDLSGYSNILPRIKFGVTRQESSSQFPTISYRQALTTIIQLTSHYFLSRIWATSWLDRTEGKYDGTIKASINK